MAGRSCEQPHHLWGKTAAWSPVLGASILPPSWGRGREQEAGPDCSSPTAAHVVQGDLRAGARDVQATVCVAE